LGWRLDREESESGCLVNHWTESGEDVQEVWKMAMQ